MRIKIDVTMDYQLPRAEPVLLTLVAARTGGQRLCTNHLEVKNARLEWIDADGLIGQRVWAFLNTPDLSLRYSATVDVTRPALTLESLAPTPFDALPAHVLGYMRPSRFCQSDLFTSFVGQEFGHLTGGAKVAAMRDWIIQEIAYVSASSNPATTAIDTFVARAGVCRDSAHLLCSMTRAANIPARYTSAYGIGVNPPDFHAVAEVWLDGSWHLVDPTGMSSADKMVVIGSGRDAVDVAFMENESGAMLRNQIVNVSPA
jgi:transglutaminase-like putative cysteine protease